MRAFVVLGIMALVAIAEGEWQALLGVGFLVFMLAVAITAWRAGAPKDAPRRGTIERRPDASVRPRWGVQHPTLTEVARGYRAVRRARGWTGGGWLPRRPRP